LARRLARQLAGDEDVAGAAVDVVGATEAGGVVATMVEVGASTTDVAGASDAPPPHASSAAVYAAFFSRFASHSSGIPLARHEYLSDTPHTVIPTHRAVCTQALTTEP
jgi:hypothetical protein